MEQGYSEAEAKQKAALDLGKQVVEAAGSGALMGFGFGSVGGAASAYKTNKLGNALYGADVYQMADEALKADPDNKLAMKIMEKLDNGKNVSKRAATKLASEFKDNASVQEASTKQLTELIDGALKADPNNALALKIKEKMAGGKNVSGVSTMRLSEQTDLTRIANAAAEQLTQLGETGDVDAISKALAKQAAGRALSYQEKQTLQNSDYGALLGRDLDTKLINEKLENDITPAEWTGKIGTDLINALEYNRLVEAENISGAEDASAAKTPTEAQISTAEQASEAKAPKQLTVEKASKNYGAQAGAFIHTYHEGQDVAEYDHAYRIAYNMGKSGVSLSYALDSAGTAYLTEAQRENAHAAGADAAGIAAKAKADKIASGNKDGKSERRKGVVKGEGVTVEDLRRRFKGDKNSPYRLLSTIAEVTGIDIVLYKSETDKNGKFVGAQGKFVGKDNTIHIDINAGLFNYKDVKYLAKHTMMRTFCHEFTHFIEKWNPEAYNEFRTLVFDTLKERGENVDDLILAKQIGKLTYEEASREVVAEAMTDILPDTKFIENLAQNHKSLFEKLLEKLKAFVSDIKKHFGLLSANSASEANAMKEQVGDTIKYLDSIVQMFDKIAVEAVENYQATVATEAKTEAGDNTKTFKVKKQSSAQKTDSVYADSAHENADAAQLIPGEEGTIVNEDGESVAQRAVKAVFPGEGAAFGSMKELIMEGLEEDAIIEGKRESSLGSIVDEIEQTLPKTEAEIDETPVEQADHDLEAVVQEQSRSYLSEEAENFRHEIDQWNSNGRKNGETFILGSTGDVLQGLGAIDNDVYMLSDKINAIFKDHPEMTIKEIKNIPEILENPVMVLASRNTAKARNNTRLSIFGMVKAKNGMPVLVIFDLHPVENKLYLSDMQKVVSAYTKDNSPNAAMKLMQNSEVLYADKNKTASLLHTVGFQNAYRIEQSGYIGSISYDDDFVNISGKPFSEIFADGEDVDQAKSREYLNSGDEAVSTFYSHMGNEGQVQYQEREETWSAHELIEYAAEHLDREGLTEGERATLDIIKGRLDKLSGLEDQRYELGRLYKEQQFSENGDREEAKKTLNRMHVLDGQIKKALEDVLPSETVDAFNRVLRNEIKNVKATDKKNYISLLKKAKDELTDKANKRIKERIDSMRERRDTSEAVKKYRERIRADAKDLMNWINHPDNKSITNHVPDALKSTIIPFLSRLNFLSKKALSGKGITQGDSKYLKELEQLQQVLKDQTKKYGPDYSDYVDLTPDFMERLQMHIEAAKNISDQQGKDTIFYINRMSADELKSLSKIVKELKRYIMQFNKFHYNEMFKHVSDAGDALIDEMLTQVSDKGQTGTVDDFVRFKNARPTHVLERFGKAGIAIRDALQKANGVYAFNIAKLKKFAQGDETTKGAFTGEEAAEWRGKTQKFKLSNGTKIEMRLSHMMGLYLLYKQEDSRRHMLNGGIRVGNFRKKKAQAFKDSGAKAVKKKYRIVQQDGTFLTEADIEMILGKLTDRQKEVADKLQKFMAEQGAEWGNYVTLARFGEKLLGANKQYYPIKVDPQMLSAEKEEMPEGASLYAMLNMGAMKSRQDGANNRIMLYDIFDVFVSHMSSMAQYNAFALPVLDATKWLNYKQVEFQEVTTKPSDWEENYKQYYGAVDVDGKPYYKHVAEKTDAPKFTAGKYYRRVETNSVRQQLTRVFGSPVDSDMGYAVEFLENLLKDINGTGVKGSEYDGMYMKVLHKYNRVKVAMNLRTAALQTTAITKAGLVVDYSSIMKSLNPMDVKQNMAEMLKYSGIAVWKDLGFYDMNVSRTLHQIITGESSFGDKVTEKGLWLAEKADMVTWSAIWGAAKKDVIRNQNLKESDKGFYEAVTRVFEEIIYKTQVVDSVLTKTELMRSKSAIAKTASSFMSESVTAASLMVSAGDQFERDARNMGRGKAFAKNKKQLVATIGNFAINSIVVSLVGALAYDMWADDDEYEEWYEKLLEATTGNILDELDLVAKIPYIADVWEPIKLILQKSFGGDAYEPNMNTPVGDIIHDVWEIVEILLDDDTKYTDYGIVYKMLQVASSITGLPMGTATREAVLLWNNFGMDLWNSTVGTMYPNLKVDGPLQTYDAGDKNEIKYAYLDGYLTEEEATKELIDKGEAKNEYEAFFMIQSWDHGNGYTKIGSYYDALTSGDDEKAQLIYDNLYHEKLANGELSIKAKNSIVDEFAGEVKKRYIEGEIDKERAKDLLSTHAGMDAGEINKTIAEADFKIETKYSWDQRDNAYRMGELSRSELIRWTMAVEGKTWADADAYVDFLDLGMDYQELDITQTITQDYFEYAEPAGITIDTYLYFYEQQKQIEGGKAEIMEFIHSLPLSVAQKDALYYAKGWAESRIHEAPWH